jgi:fumarate reductase subunit D
MVFARRKRSHEHRSIARTFSQVASLLMLLVAVALLSAITTMHFAIHGAEVQVPALKGMTWQTHAARPPAWD